MPHAHPNDFTIVKSVTRKWTSGAVLVCEKCYKTRIPDETPEIAERIGDFALREWLKEKCREAGFGKRVRVVGTTCQDVCEVGHVTVTILPLTGEALPQTFAVNALEDRETILQRILDRFRE
jgi:predicted metal-binding protein